MDTGHLRMETYKDAFYCDAYLDDEFSLDDVRSMIDEIRRNYSPPVDVILKKTGSYSVSAEAQAFLASNKIKEFRRFIYVVDNERKRSSAEYATKTYMKSYHTQIASTLEEAWEVLNRKRNYNTVTDKIT